MDNKIEIIAVSTDEVLLRSGKITHIYGPPKVGKSTLSAIIALELARLDIETLIISTERPIELRLESMLESNKDYSFKLLDKISTTNILTIDELTEVFSKKLKEISANFDVIIIDSLTAGYRTKAGPIYLTLLRKILSALQSLAINKGQAIVFTNQVSSKVESKTDFKPVAANSTRSYSDITIRLTKKFDERREIIFEDSFGEERTILEPFTIITAGIDEFRTLFDIEIKSSRKFPLPVL
jgi:RecA/RadA recombinase